MRIEHVAYQMPDPPAAAKWYIENLGFRIASGVEAADAADAHVNVRAVVIGGKDGQVQRQEGSECDIAALRRVHNGSNVSR